MNTNEELLQTIRENNIEQVEQLLEQGIWILGPRRLERLNELRRGIQENSN